MKRLLIALLPLAAVTIGAQAPPGNPVLQPAKHDWTAKYGDASSQQVTALALDNLEVPVVTGLQNDDALTAKFAANGTEVFHKVYTTGAPNLSNDVATDAVGNSYITGFNGSGTSTLGFIAKYNAAGELVWLVEKPAPPSQVRFFRIALDASGNIYVAGKSWGGFSTEDLRDDVFVVKYDNDGNQLWSRGKHIPGSNGEQGWFLALDASGQPHITGYTNSPMTSTNVITWKLAVNGDELWSAIHSGPDGGPDAPGGIALDADGNVYVAGYQYMFAGAYNFLTLKYDINGTLIWIRTLDSTGGNDAATQVKVDSSGVYVAGNVDGEPGNSNARTIKYDLDGNLLWSFTYDDPNHYGDTANALQLDQYGFPYTVIATNIGSAEGHNVMVLKYDPAGSGLIWKATPGSNGTVDVPYDAAVDSEGNVYTGGNAFSGQNDFEVMRFSQRPTCVDDTYTVEQDQILDSGTASLLDNDMYKGGASVAVDNLPSGGTVVIDPDTGTFVYTPNEGFTGFESFTYSAQKPGLLPSFSTVNIYVQPAIQSLSLSHDDIAGGNEVTATVTLVGAAVEEAVTMNATSSHPALASVPATVSVAPGLATGTFAVTTVPVAAQTTVTITVATGGSSATDTFDLRPPKVQAVTVSPPMVVGSKIFSFKITLEGPAPSSGILVDLSSDNDAASINLPAIQFPPGTQIKSLGGKTFPVAANQDVTLTAATGAWLVNGMLKVTAPVPVTFSLSPSTVVGGSNSTGSVSTNGPAVPGGYELTVTDNSGAITAPGTVTVPEGTMNASFTVSTTPVGVEATRQVFVTANGVTRSASLTIKPPGLLSLALAVSEIVGGNSTTGTVTLTAPAGGLRTVALSDNTSSISEPATVNVTIGNTSATFNVTTLAVTATATRLLTASLDGVSKNAFLTLKPFPGLISLVVSPNSVVGGTSTTGTVTLGAAAPAGGATVTLTDNSSALTTPGSVPVIEGASQGAFTIGTAPVTASYTRTVTATLDGVSKVASITLRPGD